MLRQSPRNFVESVDFITSVGFGRNGEGRAGHRGAGPSIVITDLGVLVPDPVTHELVLTGVYPDVTPDAMRDATGWDLQVAGDLERVAEPTELELTALRELKHKTSYQRAGL